MKFSKREEISREERENYLLIREVVTYYPEGTKKEIVGAFTKDGEYYIGDEIAIHNIIEEYGITPEPSHPTDKVCTIGKSTRFNCWFAWRNPRYPKAFHTRQGAVEFIHPKRKKHGKRRRKKGMGGKR